MKFENKMIKFFLLSFFMKIIICRSYLFRRVFFSVMCLKFSVGSGFW